MTVWLLDRLRFHNPVLAKDLRTRMRGTKAFVVQGCYAAVLVLMIGISYFAWWQSHRSGTASPLAISSEVGRLFYLLVFITQAALISMITPALTAGTIALEREQRTYDLLACTRLRPRTILFGKLMSGWLFVAMLLTCSLPMAALCLMFGGVSTGEIVASYLVLCLFALAFGSVGVLCSAHFSRTVTATMVTYAVIFGYLIASIAFDPMVQGPARLLNPFAFVALSGDPIRLFSRPYPAWLPAAALLPLTSLLLVNWAMTRLPHFVVNRALAIRGLLALLLVALLLLGLGTPGTPFYPSQLFTVVIPLAIGVMLSSAFLTTGVASDPRPKSLLLWMASGLDPRRIFSNQLRGGWIYMLLLSGLFAASLWVAGLLGVPPAAPLPWRGGYAAAPAATSAVTVGGTAALRVFLLLGSVVLCYSALGAVGAAWRSRAVGVALVLSLFVLTQIVPGILWLRDTLIAGSGGTESLSLYLAPYVGMLSIIDPGLLKNAVAKTLRPPIAPPFWQVTAVIYLLLSALFFALAEVIHRLNVREAPALRAELRPATLSGGD